MSQCTGDRGGIPGTSTKPKLTILVQVFQHGRKGLPRGQVKHACPIQGRITGIYEKTASRKADRRRNETIHGIGHTSEDSGNSERKLRKLSDQLVTMPDVLCTVKANSGYCIFHGKRMSGERTGTNGNPRDLGRNQQTPATG